MNMCGYVWSERGSDTVLAIVFYAGYILDVPISCATDTICLPYDLWACHKTEHGDKVQIDRGEQAVAGYPPQGVGSPDP